ncbi:MAG: hypothetical protein ACFFCW_23655 [Candidatus Hodarchaeota archaeon]
MQTTNIHMSIDPEKLGYTASKIRHDIDRYHNDLLNEYPTEQYMNLLDTRPNMASYTYTSPQLRRYCHNIIRQNDRRVLQLYHKLIIVSLIDKNRTKLHHVNLPNSIKELYMKSFERIAREIELNPDEFYEYSQDKFVKDLNICALRLIPIGPAVIDLSAVPKGFLFKKGIAQFARSVLFISFQVGGFKPLYQGHLYLRGLGDYNPHDWDHAYLRLAELLRLKGWVKGYFGYGWYFDPKVQTISPRLAYKREKIVQNGGGIFYIGSTQEDIKDATLKSPTRRRLYEEGKYTPTKYMFIWPSKRLLEWAERHEVQNPLQAQSRLA